MLQSVYPQHELPVFDLKKAENLYELAFSCIDREYPNKPNHVLGDDSYLRPPRETNPAFYGCFDWHSAVHGHWTLVTILKNFPDFQHREAILAKLKANISKENIEKEVLFFMDEHNKTFQRTYGWAWLLKLAEALREWDDPEARQMAHNLQPLEEMLAARFIEFLQVLNHPIRGGEHPNTAFGMSFAYDYAAKYHPELARQIETSAPKFFLSGKNCPLDWEPGGFDFLSPCLQEASIMLKVMDRDDYALWLEGFLPDFIENPASRIEPAVVADASDGKLAHLDGLNFSRAWCLYEIGTALKNEKIIRLANAHFHFSYEKLDSEEYMGSHWLASFATYALLKAAE